MQLVGYNLLSVLLSLNTRDSAMPARSFARASLLVCSLLLSSSWAGTAPGPGDKPRRQQAILQVQDLIARNDLARARALLKRCIRDFPADAGFDNLAGVIEAQSGNYGEAETAFQRAIERDPKLTAAYLNLGRLYQENPAISGSPEKALDIYQRLLKHEPRNAEANYQAASLLFRRREFRRSLARLSHLAQQLQETAQVLSLKCAGYAALGERKKTDEVLARLLASPDLSEADARQIAPVLQAAKREDAVASLLETISRKRALSADLRRALGLAYEASGRLDEARSTLEAFVTSGNLSVSSLLELARIADEQKDYRGSLGYVAHARDLDPGNAAVHYAFGRVCIELELIAEARDSFAKAVALQPDNASYNYAMGAASAFGHDPIAAVPYFQKYLGLKPGDARAELALGEVFFREKDYESALPWFTHALASAETATAAHYYLGAIGLRQGRLDDAEGQLEAALKSSPEYADALAESGYYYFLKRNYLESEKQLKRALEIAPRHYSANFYLLNLYARTKDPRREAQEKVYEELQKQGEEKSQEMLRTVKVRPLDTQ
jgi:tetratricopeptide (TPR) repeat protein